MSADQSIEEPREVAKTVGESVNINDDEIQQILGRDLADLILVNSPTDSVS